jgi:RNA polymerase sigma factor (TIGR02999 family)
MDRPGTHELTQLLEAWSDGEEEALEKLAPLVHAELYRLAKRYMSRERPDHLLQTSALINEAYVRLIDWKAVRWQNRAHFFGVAAQSIRHILVDHARSHLAAKRGAGAAKLSLDEAIGVPEKREVDLLALDRALEGLAALDPQQGRIVELRFFGGLSIEETAEVLHISPATVKRDWVMAKAWLYQELG